MNSTHLNNCIKSGSKAVLMAVLGLSLAAMTGVAFADKDGEGSKNGGRNGKIMWVNHFDLQAGDPLALTIASNSATSGVFPDLSGIVITPLIAGTPVLQMALDLPKETKITGVKICYANTGPLSFISQVRLAQVNVQAPTVVDKVVSDDTDLMSTTPVCVDSVFSVFSNLRIKAKNGPVLLSLGLAADPTSKILIRGIGVSVK